MRGSNREKSLLTACAGKSQARDGYACFAGKARKGPLVQIVDIIAETANREMERATRFLQFVEGGDVEIRGGVSRRRDREHAENLRGAAGNEHYERLAGAFIATPDRE